MLSQLQQRAGDIHRCRKRETLDLCPTRWSSREALLMDPDRLSSAQERRVVEVNRKSIGHKNYFVIESGGGGEKAFIMFSR